MSKEQELKKETDPDSLQLPSPSSPFMYPHLVSPPLTQSTVCPNRTEDLCESSSSGATRTLVSSETALPVPADYRSHLESVTDSTVNSYNGLISWSDEFHGSDEPRDPPVLTNGEEYLFTDDIDTNIDSLVDNLDDWEESGDDIVDLTKLSDSEMEDESTGVDQYKEPCTQICSSTLAVDSPAGPVNHSRAQQLDTEPEQNIPG